MIYKAKNKKKKFTVMDNEAIHDETLSFRARGVLAFLVSQPDDLVIYKNSLYHFGVEGQGSTWNAFQELIKAGYVVQIGKAKRNEMGQYKTEKYEYIVYDISIHSPRYEEIYNEPPPKQSKNISKEKKKTIRRLPDPMDM